MNSSLLVLLSLWAISSTVNAETRKQWSGNIKMQIKRNADATSQCSDQALQTLNENVADFLHNELLTLFGAEDAFSLGDVRGNVNGDSLRLAASFNCLDCGNAPDKKSIAQLLMFFMRHTKDAWLPEADAAMTDGCVGQDTTISSVAVFETVSATPTQPVASFDASGTKPLREGLNATCAASNAPGEQLSSSSRLDTLLFPIDSSTH
jgi:hypothetical protein